RCSSFSSWPNGRTDWPGTRSEQCSEGGRSVDDLFAVVVGDRSEARTPQLQIRGTQPLPVADLADDAQRLGTAVGARRVARKLLVGDVRVVDEVTGGLDLVDVRLPAAAVFIGTQRGHLGGQTRTVDQ